MDNFGILVFLAFISLGSAQVVGNNTTCYTCNPSTHTQFACANPVNNVPLVNCSALVPGSNWRFNCYSEFLNYNNVTGNAGWNNQTGIYRGCVAFAANGQDTWCSRMLETNVTQLSCVSCSTSGCNTHVFNAGGGIIGGGSGGGSGGGGSSGGGGGGGGGGRPGGRPGGASTTIPSILILITGLVVVSYMNNY